ncbi:MAG: hypothetical protein AB1374_07640 [Bacillota bacterium]
MSQELFIQKKGSTIVVVINLDHPLVREAEQAAAQEGEQQDEGKENQLPNWQHFLDRRQAAVAEVTQRIDSLDGGDPGGIGQVVEGYEKVVELTAAAVPPPGLEWYHTRLLIADALQAQAWRLRKSAFALGDKAIQELQRLNEEYETWFHNAEGSG